MGCGAGLCGWRGGHGGERLCAERCCSHRGRRGRAPHALGGCTAAAEKEPAPTQAGDARKQLSTNRCRMLPSRGHDVLMLMCLLRMGVGGRGFGGVKTARMRAGLRSTSKRHAV